MKSKTIRRWSFIHTWTSLICTVFLLLLGFGVIPRNFQLELFLLLTYGGWFLLWLVSLGYERAAKTRYLRLCHWALFLTVALLVLLGM